MGAQHRLWGVLLVLALAVGSSAVAAFPAVAEELPIVGPPVDEVPPPTEVPPPIEESPLPVLEPLLPEKSPESIPPLGEPPTFPDFSDPPGQPVPPPVNVELVPPDLSYGTARFNAEKTRIFGSAVGAARAPAQGSGQQVGDRAARPQSSKDAVGASAMEIAPAPAKSTTAETSKHALVAPSSPWAMQPESNARAEQRVSPNAAAHADLTTSEPAWSVVALLAMMGLATAAAASILVSRKLRASREPGLRIERPDEVERR